MSDSDQQRRDAELYSLVHSGNSGDLEFYLGFCRGARRVLELGSGYGRVAVPLAAAGCQVTGVELHPGLLGMAQDYARSAGVEERFQGHLADMCSFETAERFERIIVPYSGLFCLLSDGALSACLSRCRRHLLPGGKLGFDVYEADSFHNECAPRDLDDAQLEPVVAIHHGLEPLMVYERSSWDKPQQRLDVTYEYHDQSGTVVHHSTILQRYWLVAELEARLTAAGFSNTRVHGGFAAQPVSGLAETLVFQAQG